MPAGQLHVLLWHYFVPVSPYPEPCGNHRRFVDNLIGEGLLEYDRERAHLSTDQFEVTERGRVYVEALLKTPLPVQKWVVP